jgi:hypothetical protein
VSVATSGYMCVGEAVCVCVCGGEGGVQVKGFVQSELVVAVLALYSHPPCVRVLSITLRHLWHVRLKPRRTKLIVTLWVMLTIGVGAVTAFFLWPRTVLLTAPLEFTFTEYTGWTNCPPLPMNKACADQACSTSKWPDLPYCPTSNKSTFNATICNSIKVPQHHPSLRLSRQHQHQHQHQHHPPTHLLSSLCTATARVGCNNK